MRVIWPKFAALMSRPGLRKVGVLVRLYTSIRSSSDWPFMIRVIFDTLRSTRLKRTNSGDLPPLDEHAAQYRRRRCSCQVTSIRRTGRMTWLFESNGIGYPWARGCGRRLIGYTICVYDSY